ncbi:unnamed protein product [Rotaria sordida]|uniref:Fibronectin type-II domain-containing protein n=2 Tax=Rotaria sordida TaxID=392033 RepID=A0A818J3D5_9BILA|nr:unnamed protein product [Rotaria sordida]
MELSFLNWNKKQLLFIFILTIRLNTEAQSSNSNNSVENVPLNSNFSELTSSITRFINGVNTNDTIVFSSNNATEIVIPSSNHLDSTDIRNISTNETSINGAYAVEDILNTMNTTISHNNSPRTMNLATILYNTSNDSSVNVQPSIHQTEMLYNSSLVSNDAINLSNSFDSVSYDLLENTTAITNVNSSKSSIENNITSNIIISTLINLNNSIQLNQLNESSLLNDIGSLNSSAIIDTNTTSMFLIWNTTVAVQPVRDFSMSVPNTYEISNSSNNTIVENFDATMLSFMNSTDNERLNISDSLNTTLITLPLVVDTLISNLTYQNLLPSANDTLTQTTFTVEPTNLHPELSQQTASNVSLEPASPSLSNQNLTLSNNTSETVTSLMSEMTGLPLLMTNFSNSNLSSFSNEIESHMSTALLHTESVPETVQQTDRALPITLSTLIFSEDNLVLTSNTTQTNFATESLIRPQLQNTAQTTNDTLVSTLTPSDEPNAPLASEPNLSQSSVSQDVFPTEPAVLVTQETFNPLLPTENVQINLNQSAASPFDGIQMRTSANVMTPQPIETLSSDTNLNETLPQPLNSTQGALPFESSRTELSPATMQPTFDTLPPIISSTNLSNQSSPEVLDITQGTVPLDSLVTELSAETIQQTPITLTSLTSLENISNESLIAVSAITEEAVSVDSLWTDLSSATMLGTADSLPLVTTSTNVSDETLVALSNSTQVSSPSDSLATNLPIVLNENITNTLDFITISSSLPNTNTSSSMNNTEIFFGSASSSTEVPSFTVEGTIATVEFSQVSSIGSSETMSLISNTSDMSASPASIPMEEMPFTTLQAVEITSLVPSATELNQNVSTSSIDIQTDSSNHSIPMLVSSVTEQESWSIPSSTSMSSFPLNDSLASSATVTSTNILPISETIGVATDTAESTGNTLEPIVPSSISPNESLPSSFNETQTNMLSSSMFTTPSFITVQNTLDTFPSEQLSASVPNQSESILLTTIKSNEVDGSFASQNMISSTITREQTTNNLPVTQSSLLLQNESLSSSSSNTLQDISSNEGIIDTHTITIEQTTNTPISSSIPSFAPNQDSSFPVSLDTIANSPTSNTEETTQPPMSTESLLSTLAETNPTETIYINNGIDTAESSSITVQVTAMTPLPTLSLLTRLMSSSLSQSTVFSNSNDYIAEESTIESTETNFVTSSQELTSPNQYSTNSRTSNLLLLLTTLMSHSEVTTSSLPTVTSMPISITEPTSFSQSFSDYSTVFSSSVPSLISSIQNTNPDIGGKDSTSATNINRINSISSSQQVPESLETTVTITSSMPLETTSTIISSIQSSSVTSSTLANTLSNVAISIPSETLTNTVSSLSSISIDNERNTMNTILISNTYMSQTSPTPIISSSFETQTISTSLPSLNNITDVPSRYSSNIQDMTDSENPSSSTFHTIFLTLIRTSMSSSDSSISSSMTSQTTSYSFLETTASTQTISTSTITSNGTTFLSLLLTTSGVLMSNETSTTRNMSSNIPFTTQINFNTTNIPLSSNCVFPFRYLGQWYEKCISDILNDSWCSLTVDFDRDRQWKYCRAPRVKTIGGTGNGSDCVFPFVYKGTSFSTCIYRTETTITSKSFVLFCSVTSNLDQHGLWGYYYDSCYFPFIYNGNVYSDCISGPQSARWCSTTSNFDRNKMWSNCPVTCDGYPQQDQNSVGFRLLLDQRPCVFKQSIARDTGVLLKYYALPICQLEPLCRDNYVPLFKQILCQEDGRYSYPRTICLPNRSNRDVQYILIPNRKPKITPRYYYYDDDDDDNDNEVQLVTTNRRIVRTKPIEEQRTKHVKINNFESEDRQQNVTESNDHGIKIRNTSDGEQIIFDEDDNIIKIIRNKRTPTPPIVDSRRLRNRRHEPRTVYYETSDGHLITRQPNNYDLIKNKSKYVYINDEPTKILRKVIIKPTINDHETIYEKDKYTKHLPRKFKIQKHINEISVDTDTNYEKQQPQYVEIVRRRIIPREVITEKESPKKYVLVRKKLHSEPIYETTSPLPTITTNRRMVREAPTKKISTKHVYATDEKYYK